ncbi:Subtilisin inhibitor [Euphorbia peplus]|nr:Subtilisin inhibitor [Euphorbia peplus]
MENKQPSEETLGSQSTASSEPRKMPGGRKTWPELVGLTAEEAERKIKEEMGRATVQVVPPNCFVTMDFRSERVRLYIDSSGKVARPPMIG